MSSILIIDDDAGFRQATKATLRATRAEVWEAEDADHGLEMVRTRRPDLVLCDLHLERGSGWDVLGAMRADRTTANIPLILATGSNEPLAMRQSMDLGADDFLEKPFSPEMLLAAVNTRLRKLEASRAEAEQARQDGLIRSRAIADAAFDAIIMMGPDGSISFWNPAAERIFGYSRAEALGRTLHALLVPGPYREAHDRAFPHFLGTGQGAAIGQTLELTALRKDGTEFPVELSLSAVFLDGQWHAVGVVRDITERKRVEKALHDSQELYASLVENMPQNVFRKDRDGRFLFCNRRFRESAGRSSEEIVGKTDADFFPPELAAAYRQDDLRVMDSGRTLDQVEENVGAEGRKRFVQVVKTPLHDASGAVAGIQGIFWDITERKHVEQALRESEEKHRLLYVSSRDAIMTLAPPSWRFTGGNPAAIAMFAAQDEAAFCAAGPWEVSPERQPDGELSSAKAPRMIETAIAKGTHSFEWTHRRLNGADFPATVLLNRVDHLGQVFLQATVRDITEVKRAEQERALMQAQVSQAQKLESIGKLAAGIAHEINTPIQFVGDNIRFAQKAVPHFQQSVLALRQMLNSVRAASVTPEMIQQVEHDLKAADMDYLLREVPTAVRESLEGVDRITCIVRAMKEFSHPSCKDRTLVNLNHAIESTVTVARNEWKYVAEMALELDPILPPVPCFASEINQAVLNLVVNAAHAIADVLKTRPGPKGAITLRTRRVDDWAEIQVADTGTGIPEAIRERVYDPFFTTKAVGKGTGQGLTIVHNSVVQRHGGSIRFETEMGRGTTFFVRLPLHPKGHSPPRPPGETR